MDFDAVALEKEIGYQFESKEILREALTHPSYSGEKNNERLEFLGDAVLGLLVSRHLYLAYPSAEEGELTKRRSAIVCGRSLKNAALKIGLGEYILLGKGEELAGGRGKQSVLENAMEAVLGAVFLDGGPDAAKEAVQRLILSGDGARGFQNRAADTILGRDYKSYLQETVQAGENETIVYETYRTEGPPHDTVFYVRLYIGGTPSSSGKGKSKKEAEQQAAKAALDELYKIKL